MEFGWIYFLSISISGVCVPVSYIGIVGNALGIFSIPTEDMPGHPRYIKSLYWMGMWVPLRYILSALQLCAAGGYMATQVWYAFVAKDSIPGFLQAKWVPVICSQVIIIFSALWPIPAYTHILNPTIKSFVGSTICLWCVSASGIVMMVGLVLAQAPTWVLISWSFFCFVVVISDGLVWMGLSMKYLISKK